MVKRRKIGLIYQYNETWIGGTYYVQNLISAVNQLDDELKPLFVILCNDKDQFRKLAEITGYPYLEHGSVQKQLNILQRASNRVVRNLTGKNLFNLYTVYEGLGLVFPASMEQALPPGQKFLYWIPDFQEHYLPEFFSEKELASRKSWHKQILDHGKFIVFSSYAAQTDFNTIYPSNKLQQFVIRFAVSHPSLQHIQKSVLLTKFNIPGEYFICSNQFWKHKNQGLVLEAIALMKNYGTKINVAFTGKEHDFRNPLYFDELKQRIDDLGIKDQVHFLGFISREDQLALMSYSKAVIQPSMFEGWSTVVEDAKALRVPMVVSNLAVHREQLEHYSSKVFFEVTAAESLAEALSGIQNKERVSDNHTYKDDILRYGQSFINTINAI